MIDEIDKRIADSRPTSPDTSTTASPPHQHTEREGESITEFKVDQSQVADSISSTKEAWFPGEDCVRQATDKLGTLQELTLPEAMSMKGEGGCQEAEGGAVDILYPMRSKESYAEIQEVCVCVCVCV